eukprot:m.90767 g.90767  ORF g.90767 m.90767 type:complete len:58 (+) comp36667_c1_seq1:1508-1681(+)
MCVCVGGFSMQILFVKRLLKPTVDKAHVFISSLTEEDFKNKVNDAAEMFKKSGQYDF